MLYNTLGTRTLCCNLKAEGDVGTIAHCIPNGEDGDECKSCFTERSEEEEKEGDEKTQSPLQSCLDKCAAGYRVTQLGPETLHNIECEMNGGEDCEETKYQRIALEPQVGCVDGCSCPNATGYMEAPDDADADADAETYVLQFWQDDGEVNTYYTGGTLEIKSNEGGGGGGEDINEVTLAIKYVVLEIKDDDAQEQEQVEMQCSVPYFIEAGTVGGVVAKSGAPAPAPGKQPVAQASGNGKLERTGTSPVDRCHSSNFEKGTPDACWLECSEMFSVITKNNTFIVSPDKHEISDGCACNFGNGYQLGYGHSYSAAQVTFEVGTPLCTPIFDSELMNVSISANGLLTLSWTTALDSTLRCTSAYKVTSGSVLGVSSTGRVKGSGAVVGGILIAVILVVVAIFVAVHRGGTQHGAYQRMSP